MRVLFWMFMGFDKHETSEHLMTAVIKRLCENGHEVHIIQRNTGGSLPTIPEELSGYSVTTDTILFREPSKSNFIARYLAELKYIYDCRRSIKGSYDAVFIQSNNVAGFAVWMIRRSLPQAAVTFNVQDIFPDNAVFTGRIRKNSIVEKAMSAEQRYAYSHSDSIITISEDMMDTLVSDGADPEKISVVYNWSYNDEPYEGLDPSPVRDIFREGKFNVVYAGNIGMMQNVDIIIDTARLMKDDEQLWFHIIGNGMYKETLREKAAEYGIENISFWPMQPPEKAPLIYSAASVNIIPLVKDVFRTALPSKTAVCLACGQPVVFAIGKESRFAQKLSAETGCPCVESDSPEELAEAIRDIKEKMIETDPVPFFRKSFIKTVNSKAYADIITGSEVNN